MSQTYTLSCPASGGNYEFRITAQASGEAPNASLQISVVRKDRDAQPWTWDGPLTALQNPVAFELRFDDGINMKGRFFVFGQRKAYKGFLFMDVFYGLNTEHHFEGNIFELN